MSGIFLSNPDGTFDTIVDNSSGLSVGDPSLNFFGRVAFTGSRFDENFTQIFSINTSRGGAVTTVAGEQPGWIRIVPRAVVERSRQSRFHRGCTT